jgi:hypothetical protein
MECDRRTFVRASAAGVAAVGSAGAGVAAAQENGSGNQSGNESGNATGGAGGQAGGGNASGGNASGGEGGEGGGEASGSSVDTQGLLIIFGAAVMAALSPLAFAVLLLARGRGGKDGNDETPSGGKRYGGGQS